MRYPWRNLSEGIFVDSRDISQTVLEFWPRFALTLWCFSEAAKLGIGESAPLVFGLMLGVPGLPCEPEGEK